MSKFRMEKAQKRKRNRQGGLGADASKSPGATSMQSHSRDVLRGQGPCDRVRVALGAGWGLGPDTRGSEGRQARRPEGGQLCSLTEQGPGAGRTGLWGPGSLKKPENRGLRFCWTHQRSAQRHCAAGRWQGLSSPATHIASTGSSSDPHVSDLCRAGNGLRTRVRRTAAAQTALPAGHPSMLLLPTAPCLRSPSFRRSSRSSGSGAPSEAARRPP